jgi:hypothetical protein
MPIVRRFISLSSILIILILSRPSSSQFFGWNTVGSGTNNGTNGIVNAIAKYNNLIIVGGSFTHAGQVNVSNIAAWNGSNWISLGSGVNDTVFALTVYEGNLIAGGKFTNAGGGSALYIAQWNGSSWSALGSGMNGAVLALDSNFSGKMTAAGRFTTPGNYIAQWNGSTWSTLGTGMNNEVYTLLKQSGSLYAGGKFTTAGGYGANRIALWSGTAWSNLSSGMNDNVYALASYGGYIVAGGSFTQAGGSSISYLAEWSGSMWSGFSFQLDSAVYSLAYYPNTGSLIVGGSFINAGSLFVNRICKWDGSGCQRMVTGTNNRVRFLAVIDTNLFAGGEFSTAGGDYANHTAIWQNLVTHPFTGIVKYASDTTQVVTSGVVKAERLDVSTREIIVIDTAVIQPDGTYVINHGIGDSTDVVAFPNDELPDSFVPTYYPSSISWASAVRIYPNTNLNNINIHVISVIRQVGVNHIGGHVYLNIAPPFNQPGFPFSRDAIVYAKQGNIYRRFAITDSTQRFVLDSLVPGTYDLTVDRIGYTSSTRTVNLSASNVDTINIYLDTMTIFGIQKIGTKVPAEFSLYQNYPNPFNPSTVIRFDLNTKSMVTLKIYNELGQLIETLVNEQLTPGEYRVTFNSSNRSSGIYFYMLNTSNYSETKKMVLVK